MIENDDRSFGIGDVVDAGGARRPARRLGRRSTTTATTRDGMSDREALEAALATWPDG